MSQPFDHLAKDLQPHYSRFDVANRLLFTGHSHQAWPDAAFEGMHEYETTVARDVDQKWIAAAEKTEILRNYLRRYYDDPNGYWCREQNTHVLMVSWLSSLDLLRKPVILTTSGEFHSMSRQLRSLAKIGVEPVILDHSEDETLLQSIRSHLNNRVSAVMLSRIYFQTAEIQTRLTEIAAICRDAGVPLMIDDYHGTNVVPLSLREAGLEDCYLLIGGYKYLQWGEANCFLRFPGNCSLTPLITGWFAAFGSLDQPKDQNRIDFDEGDQKFATATYDPVSQFRAASVVHFFDQQGLTPQVLENQYRSQVQFLTELFEGMNGPGSGISRAHNRSPQQTGGFLSLRSDRAREIRATLLSKGVYTDARNDLLRIGPAPYTTSEQCIQMMKELFAVV